MYMDGECKMCHRHMNKSDQRQHLFFSTTLSPKPTSHGEDVRGHSCECNTATACTLKNRMTTINDIIEINF